MLIKELNQKEEVAPEKEWCVYVHECLVNGKKYVGITSQDVKKRWQYGNGYKRNQYFWRAIKAHGWDNFTHTVVASHLTESEAKAFEILLIKKLDTQNPEHGYNISPGGDGVGGVGLTGESKEKMRQTLRRLNREKHPVPVYQYDRDLNFIERFDSAVDACYAINGNGKRCRAIYDCCDLRDGCLTAFDYVWSYLPDDEVDKEFLRERIIYDKLPKKIYQYDLEGNLINEFNSISDAAKLIGVALINISCALNGKHKTCGGFVWLNEGEKFVKPKDVCKRSVDQYTLDGEYIRTFDSYKAASESVGVTPAAISAACRSETHKCREYIFKLSADQSLIESHKRNVYNNRSVLQFDENGNIVHEYVNVDDACNSNGIHKKHLQNALRNENHTVHGYFWYFKDDEDGLRSFVPHKILNKKTAISKIDDDGNIVDTYNSIKQAAEANHLTWITIKRALNDPDIKCGGYKWIKAN